MVTGLAKGTRFMAVSPSLRRVSDYEPNTRYSYSVDSMKHILANPSTQLAGKQRVVVAACSRSRLRWSSFQSVILVVFLFENDS